MKERDLLALSALLYRIGAFWQRTGIIGRLEKEGSGTHLPHIAWSNLFLREYVIPSLAKLNGSELLTGFSYKPSESSDTPKPQKVDIQLLIQEGDYLAAQYRGETSEGETRSTVKLTSRLESITEQIAVTDKGERWRNAGRACSYYPIRPLALSKEIFPSPNKENDSSFEEEYKNTWGRFISEYEKLPQGGFTAYFDSLVHLLQKYAWCVPMSVQAGDPNISLFDHSRVTAALTMCLYESAWSGDEPKKEFLLIEGDISGIQNFIYNPAFNGQEVQDGMARRLRGRSFYLNLLVRTIADYLTEKLDLYSVNTLWATGGHFLIIAPNTPTVLNNLEQSRNKIRQWLWREFRGALGISIADYAASRDEIRDFSAVRERLGKALAQLKLQQFAAPLSFEDQGFDNAWQSAWVLSMQNGICCDTGRDLSDKEIDISTLWQKSFLDEGETARPRSSQSLLFDSIGYALTKAQTIQLNRAADWNIEDIEVTRLAHTPDEVPRTKEARERVLIQFPDFDRAWLLSATANSRSDADLCLRIADHRNPNIDFLQADPSNLTSTTAQGFEMMADAVKTKLRKGREVITDFHELAKAADGAEFLGVLRMDVDNLGYVFAEGLPQGERSASKIANLSRMMNWFFAGYLNTLVNGRNLYTTYAGGDDLFVAGAWNETLQLAEIVQKDFKEFCGNNPDLHISGGIALCKGKFPIGRAANYAGQKLNAIAKSRKRERLDPVTGKYNPVEDDTDKDALAFLERKIPWARWDQVRALGDQLIAAIEGRDKKVSRKFIYNLLELYEIHIDPQRDLTKEWLDPDFVWVPKFLYSLVRNVPDKLLCSQLQTSVLKQRDYLSVLAGYILLSTRQKRESESERKEN